MLSYTSRGKEMQRKSDAAAGICACSRGYGFQTVELAFRSGNISEVLALPDTGGF